MSPVATKQLQTITLRQSAHPITGAIADMDPLMDRIGEARFVLIGEASHGTHVGLGGRRAARDLSNRDARRW